MRIKTNVLRFSVLILTLLLLSGCGASEPVPEAAPATATTAPTATLTPTPEPTSTLLPTYNLSLQVTIPSETEGETLPFANSDVKINNDLMHTDENGMIIFEALTENSLELTIWSQGYLAANSSISMQPGANESGVALEIDPYALQPEIFEGYTIAYIEDFQDSSSDFIESKGNFGVFEDENDPGNYLLEVDLRDMDESFNGSFGETGINDFIVQVRFRYPEIDYYDFSNDYHNWQGYGFDFRGAFSVQGYPLQVPWGPTFQFMDASEDNWQFPVTVPQSINEGRWYTLKVVATGSVVEGYINGVRRFRYLQAPEAQQEDNIQIIAFTKAWLQYDDIVLWVPAK